MADDPQAQHYVECTQCNRNAEYYCNTCTDRLCLKCKKKHLISNASKNHDVVIYQDKQTSAPPIESCQIHFNLPYIICCQQCEVPVCQKCIVEKHKGHSFIDTDIIFESKKEEYRDEVSRIKEQLLPECNALLEDVQTDNLKIKEEIAKIQSAMTSKAQALKDIIDAILAENTEFLQGLENSLISELQQQENTMNSHIAYLQNIVDEYEKYISTNNHAGFILFQKENPISDADNIPKLNTITLPTFNDGEVLKEELAKMFGNIQESIQSSTFREARNVHGQQAEEKNDMSMKLIPTATKMMSFTPPGVNYNHHISTVTADQAWISDYDGNLVLTDMKGKKLNEMKYTNRSYGCHTTSHTGDLLFLNDSIIYKVASYDKEPVPIIDNISNRVICIYSSPSTQDVLVGVGFNVAARVIRYKKTGQEVHQIQYDNTGQPLYDWPNYITENHINGDVCVSDCDIRAVVVVDRDRNYRFSYTGHPPGSELKPYGISTDTQGHILVSDVMSNTVQMTDKNGHFLSFLLTTEQGIVTPAGLSLDVKNNRLWVGELGTTVSVFRYKPQ